MHIEIPKTVKKNLEEFFSRNDLCNSIAIYSAGGLTKAVFRSGLIDGKRISAVFDRNSALQSDMYDEAIQKGYFVNDPMNANYKRAVLETKDWTAQFIQDMAYAMNIELNFVHNSNMRLGNHSLALECFEKVLKVKPDHAIAYHYAACCLECLGDIERAAQYRARAFKHAENPFWTGYIEMFGIPIDLKKMPCLNASQHPSI